MTRRGYACSLAGVAVVVLTLLLFVVHVPYSVLGPGPVCNTVGPGNSSCPATGSSLVTVSPPSKDFASGSKLGFTTVSVGNGEPSIATALSSWLSASQAVVPREAIVPPDQTRQQVAKQDVRDMQQAQDNAVTAAESALGLIDVRVATVAARLPAAGVVKVGDVITAVDGKPVTDSAAVSAGSGGNDTSVTHTLTVRRGDETLQLRLHKAKPAGADQAVFGIGLKDAERGVHVAVTLDPKVVGGPSAGLMFALGVYDRLTPGNLAGHTVVAGTGTIDALGVVGPIGGIQQKMYAARHDFHATVFLAPVGDCAETRGAIPSGLRVVKVGSLGDALHALAAVRAGDLTGLPRC